MRDNTVHNRAYRIGIDVGGTFTKAVLIDNASREVVGRYSVMTTHDHPRGVAAGVVEVFRNVLERSGVAPGEVVFLAHSTTQATNALLEGDVAKVGVLGMSGRTAAKLAEPQVAIGDIELAPGRWLPTANRFLVAEDADDAAMRAAVQELGEAGAKVLVASTAFGVDNTATEERIRTFAQEAGLLTTCGHEITRLYGLTTRTRTAVLNASILPKMNATAEMTEASVREAGISAPLMIMRGDGGVMDIHEMRRRPAMTMLSGPAASVAGALMHLRVSDGIYFEVGGTSTNIGVIRSGRPTVTYARVGGHETFVSSLDVRVLGVAGGSLVRAEAGRIVDVGPRSAHIAGLAYAAFAEPAALSGAVVELFEPRPGDGAYVALRTAGGQRFAITTTCAANALGYTRPGMHAHAGGAAARLAFEALAAFTGLSAEATARAVLACAADKIVPVVRGLVAEYQLDPDQQLLIGEGGGAGALVPFAAEALGFKYEISLDAEVISSIGVALALVRDVVERIIPHPQPADLQAIREEARAAAVRMGADPDQVDVTVEVDQQTHRVRAVAMGAAEMHVKDEGGGISEAEARAIASRSLGVAGDRLVLAGSTPGVRVYQVSRQNDPGEPAGGSVRAVDWQGTIRIQRSRSMIVQTRAADAESMLADLWVSAGGSIEAGHNETGHNEAGYNEGPGLLMLHGRHVIDLSGIETLKQAVALAASECEGLDQDAAVVLVALPR